MAQGPWGGNGGGDGGRPRGDGERPRGGRREPPQDDRQRPGRPPAGGPGNQQIPEIDELMRKGQERLRAIMGGRHDDRRGPGGPTGGPGGGMPPMPRMSRGTFGLIALAAVALWAFNSVYTVNTEEEAVELLFGRPIAVVGEGLNFAPWPVVTYEVVRVTEERTVTIGKGEAGAMDSGLMLTRDQTIVDMEYQVVWNISDPEKFLFNLADPQGTIRAVGESAMRDIVARSELAPILNRDRLAVASELTLAVQRTLDEYQAGIHVVRVNLDRADPPREVIDSFLEVQAAQQRRDQLEKEADAYANRVLAAARGEAAALLEGAEADRARAVNSAEGAAARFNSVYAEYVKAPEVTRERLYLETMERVLGASSTVLIDQPEGAQGVLPYLPLDALKPGPGASRGPAAPSGSGTGGNGAANNPAQTSGGTN